MSSFCKNFASCVKSLVVGVRSPLFLVFIVYALTTFGINLLEVPTVRLFENALCTGYYMRENNATEIIEGKIVEAWCKIPIIQDNLGLLRGWRMSLDAIPGLLTSVFYGSVANKYGHRFVLLLASVGQFLNILWIVLICTFATTLPVQLVWVSAAFLLIGGGQRTFNSMIFTIVSDSLDHSERTKYLYWLASIPHINRVITPRIAAGLMSKNLYLPFCVTSVTFVLTIILVLTDYKTVESRQLSYKLVHSGGETDSVDNAFELMEHNQEGRDRNIELNPLDRALDKKQTQSIILQVIVMVKTPNVKFCLSAFYLKRVAFASLTFVFQWSSEKFNWELRQTTWLRVSQAVGSVLVTLIVLPYMVSLFTKRDIHTDGFDLTVLRISLALEVVAFLWIWASPSGVAVAAAVFLCGLGEGIEPSLQGVATFITDSTQNTVLFISIAVCDTVAELTGGPLAAQLLTIGRRPDHASYGISFVVSSTIFGILCLWACLVKVKWQKITASW